MVWMWVRALVERGARPRLVWRMTPVALMTERRDGVNDWVRCSRTAIMIFSMTRSGSVVFPDAIPSRNRFRTSRADSLTATSPSLVDNSTIAGKRRKSSKDGSIRYSELGPEDMNHYYAPFIESIMKL